MYYTIYITFVIICISLLDLIIIFIFNLICIYVYVHT